MISQYRHRDTATTDKSRITVERVHIKEEYEDDYDLSWLTDPHRYDGESPEDIALYTAQDQRRIDSYHAGEWHGIGISATAEIWRNHPGHAQLVAHVESGGLWGIESDSGREYINEVANEQLDELTEILTDLGIDPERVRIAIEAARP